jgi:hypothetical protein
MIPRRRRINGICLALALAVLFLGDAARAQKVILQLRNGDRVAGTIVSENAETVTVSTVWIKELVIPIEQIQRRDYPPTEIATVTNIAPITNVTVLTNVAEQVKQAKAVLVAAANAPPTNWWQRWKGEIAAGTDLERGAIDHELYFAKAKLTYTQPYRRDTNEFFRNIFTYDAGYGKTAGVLSDNRMGGSSKTDVDVSPRVYLYNLGTGYYDEIRKIDLHYEDGPGAGYHLFKGTNFSGNVELGANYQVEDRSDGTRTESFYYRAGEDLAFKLNKVMTFTEKGEILPRANNFEQFRSRIEANLSYALIFNFSLTFSVVDFYDTQPALGVPNNDLQFRTLLGFKF